MIEIIDTKFILPEKCECGRLFKDRIDKNGKAICALCHTGLSIDDLKKLWGSPIKTTFGSNFPVNFRQQEDDTI